MKEENREAIKRFRWMEKAGLIEVTGKKSFFFDTRKVRLTKFGQKLLRLKEQPKLIPLR